MTPLTRRKDPHRPDCWLIYFGDVHVGKRVRSARPMLPKNGDGSAASIPAANLATFVSALLGLSRRRAAFSSALGVSSLPAKPKLTTRPGAMNAIGLEENIPRRRAARRCHYYEYPNDRAFADPVKPPAGCWSMPALSNRFRTDASTSRRKQGSCDKARPRSAAPGSSRARLATSTNLDFRLGFRQLVSTFDALRSRLAFHNLGLGCEPELQIAADRATIFFP